MLIKIIGGSPGRFLGIFWTRDGNSILKNGRDFASRSEDKGRYVIAKFLNG